MGDSLVRGDPRMFVWLVGICSRLKRFMAKGGLAQTANVGIFAAERRLSLVDRYWNEHTVNSKPFESAGESDLYLQWRFEQYPLFREYMEMYGTHEEEVILDYGCGPGDDVVGFLLHTGARKVIGVDVSAKALSLARHRLSLHQVDASRIVLVRCADASTSIPLRSEAIDFINCGGVLHHTSEPEAILREFYRVLKRGRRANIMVYNRNSIWLHLYTAYIRMVVEEPFDGLDLETAFARNTDGEQCPISRCYEPDHFIELLEHAGFQGTFVGGYLSLHELKCLKEWGAKAVHDMRLAEEHRNFLKSLAFDEAGLPTYQGRHAGIGGVYRVYKP